jgi:Tol biopolymer transport system component
MNYKIILTGLLLAACFGLNYSVEQERVPVLKGKYLGQKVPGLNPLIFAKGIVSTKTSELNCVFTPDGKELYFTSRKTGKNTLMVIKQEQGLWTAPSVVSFSGSYSDVDPYVTADGKRLYFSSSRPLSGSGPAKDADLWYVERTAAGTWGTPVRLQNLNSAGKDDYYTSISRQGTLYFSIFETHGSPGDIYLSRNVKGTFGKPEKVKGPVNTEHNEHDPFIAPDESYLIFTSNRPGGYGRNDLYIVFRKPDGTWTEARNMGKTVNSEGYDFCPMLSPDGKYLFFTRNINRNGDIYWVDAKIIDAFRPVEK